MKWLSALFLLLAAPALAQTAIRPDQISPGTPDITWLPGGAGYQIGTTVPWLVDSTIGPIIFTTANLSKNVELTNIGAITATVPDATGATGSFADGTWFVVQVKAGTLTLNRTTTASTINGLATIKVGSYQTVVLLSRSSKWYAVLGFPQPATQTGANKLKDNMTWAP